MENQQLELILKYLEDIKKVNVSDESEAFKQGVIYQRSQAIEGILKSIK